MRQGLFPRLWTAIKAMSFYAVKRGRKPGVYETWAECEEQVCKFTGARYKKFSSQSEGWAFVNEEGGEPPNDDNGEGIKTEPTDKTADHIRGNRPSPEGHNFNGPRHSGGVKNAQESKLNSIMSTMNLFRQQLAKINALADTLASEILEFKTAASSGSDFQSGANFYNNIHGAQTFKRSFSTECGESGAAPPKKCNFKKFKSDSADADHWTGQRFDMSSGVPVYTDGACSDNGRNGARAGIGVFWGDGDARNFSGRLPGRPTNNRAEIHAARKAIEQAKESGIRNLILHTDSQFLISSITTWIKGWKRNEWVTTSGEPVINKEDFLELDQVLKGINIKWVHVRGHRGIPGNEAADKLAIQGARKSLNEK